MRRVGATTSSSRRSRGFEVSESSVPAPAAQRSVVAPRTSSDRPGSAARPRAASGAGGPARHRLDHKPRFPDVGEHQHDPDLVGGSGARRAGGIARHHHRQVRSLARVDLRHRARHRRHGGSACRGFRLRIRMADCDRHSRGAGGRRPGRLHQRLHGGEAEAQRLHRDACDADHPARHAGRRDARADVVRPARRRSTA